MKIRLVDGFKIRNTLDINFIDLHFRGSMSRFVSKLYIPKGEMWLDHIFELSGERKFLLRAHYYSEKFFTKPIDSALYAEYRDHLKKKLCLPGPVPSFVQRRKRIDGKSVLYVNGTIIRRHLDPEFVSGGHDLVYGYVPKNQIWIDTITVPEEQPFVLLHEQVEQKLMAEGKKYDNAHRFALAAEMEARIAAGVGMYPGDENYLWSGLPDSDLIKQYTKSSRRIHRTRTTGAPVAALAEERYHRRKQGVARFTNN